MPNICSYSMSITGKTENVDEMIEIMRAHYNCVAGDPLHLWRVFSAEETERETNEDNITTVRIVGDCAWSVSSCMLGGGYNLYRKSDENQNGTTLEQETKRLMLAVEVYSEECGNAFMEHYIIANGEFVTSEVVEWDEYCMEDFEDVDDFNKSTGEHWTKEQFESYDEDYYESGGMDWDFEDGIYLYEEYVIPYIDVDNNADIEPVSEDELNAILAS